MEGAREGQREKGRGINVHQRLCNVATEVDGKMECSGCPTDILLVSVFQHHSLLCTPALESLVLDMVGLR
jgi:hypothetical protein